MTAPIFALFEVTTSGVELEREIARGTAAEILADNDGDPEVSAAIDALIAGAESAPVGGGAGTHVLLRWVDGPGFVVLGQDLAWGVGPTVVAAVADAVRDGGIDTGEDLDAFYMEVGTANADEEFFVAVATPALCARVRVAGGKARFTVGRGFRPLADVPEEER